MMNKSLMIILFMIVATWDVKAQFNVGPKIGINTSNFVQDFSSGGNQVKAKYGFQAGLFSRADFLFLFIQPEILYMNGNGMVEVTNSNDEAEWREYEFNRTDFPIFLGFKLGKAVRIGVGPVFSLLKEETIQGSSISNSTSESSTVGFLAGIGVDVWNLVVDLRYEGPLGDFEDSVLGVTSDQRLNQLTLSVGLKLFTHEKKDK